MTGGADLELRKQYYFRPSKRGYFAWDVDRLVTLARDLQPKPIRLDAIKEIDEPIWFGNKIPELTWRSMAEHIRLIQETDLNHPIILAEDGRVMDGMHRVAKAAIEGRETIQAVQFAKDPEPDYVDVYPDDLPY